jgi:ribosome-associated protein
LQFGLVMMHINKDVTLNERDVVVRFVRASGPRGVNREHDATAVELRLDLGTAALPQAVAERLAELGGRHINADGVLVVVARGDESQARNREAAWKKLTRLIVRAADEGRPRRPTHPRRAVRKAQRQSKEQHSAVKRGRRSTGAGD